MSEMPITRLLASGRAGDVSARDRFAAAVYPELRRLAGSYLRRERSAETLQPTALLHEAYLRLTAEGLPDCESRRDFYALAARRMRQVLVDHARARRSAKRGGDAPHVAWDDGCDVAAEAHDELLALEDALTCLEKLDPRKHRVIELRFFAGLSVQETAELLGVSVATVGREQRLGEAWLHRELRRA